MKKIKKWICGIVLFCVCGMLLAGCDKEKEVVVSETITEITTEAATKATTEVTTEERTEEATEATTEEVNPRESILIALDPGHQGPSVDMSAKEPNAPGSDVMKAKATSGTAGKFTGVGEYELNLSIAKQVRGQLESLGYRVIMTREDNETAISNMERANLANEAGADVSIRLHANGSEDSGTNGALALVGSQNNAYVGGLYSDSYRLATSVLDSYCAATGMKNLGVQGNDTMTGINWSQVPVMILEMGFMSNESDDRNMQDASYQANMVRGIVQGIEDYFGMDGVDTPSAKEPDNMKELQSLLETAVGNVKGAAAVYVEDLSNGGIAETGNKPMVAASLIKLYVAGCIYELQENSPETAPDGVDDLIEQMITVSDNEATNTLVKKLGNGDASAGMEKVNAYCRNHGLTDTSMGRLMLDFSSGGENYTSVEDTAAFLRSVYRGKLSGSEKILSYLKKQERTGKIPAGVPAGVETGNKTGELDNVENDVAIVFAKDHPYVISVMTGELSDTASARSWIVDLSSKVYEGVTQ